VVIFCKKKKTCAKIFVFAKNICKNFHKNKNFLQKQKLFGKTKTFCENKNFSRNLFENKNSRIKILQKFAHFRSIFA
jgi:hypothetical protein